jgi:acyl-CoA reductase-like NAD-dependent aldehyde dehydrogenase
VSLTHKGRLYIAGEWVVPEGKKTEAVINPATEAVIDEAGLAGPRDVEAALAAARAAFDSGPWPRLSMRERAAKVAAMCDWIETRGDALRALVAAETGSIEPFARTMQFATGLEHARHYIELALRQTPQPLPLEPVGLPDGRTMLGGGVAMREPMGVCLAITPFNVPFMLNLGKAVPALLMGNTVIIKPSPLTPLSALILAEAAHAAGLPAGALNVVNGDLAVGEALTTDPRVDLITFTGSDRVGAAIQAQAAPTLKRCIMELGGKSAMIVRADGNLDAAAQAALASLTFHAGQACAALTRLVIHNSVRSAFVAKLAEMFRAVKIGDPADPAVRMGPLIRDAARARVQNLVDSALTDGARLITGGRIPPGLDRGFFYEPTLFDEVHNSWRVAREEAFGPLGVVIGFDTDEEAVAIANDSDFGLSGAVYSADVGHAYELAKKLRTGKVNLNGGSGKMSSYHPFGGIKRSGYGREFGDVGLHEFTYIKTIAYHVA